VFSVGSFRFWSATLTVWVICVRQRDEHYSTEHEHGHHSPSNIRMSYFLHTSSTASFLSRLAEQPEGLHPVGVELHLVSPTRVVYARGDMRRRAAGEM
jgi:hypothetical protein